MDGRDFVKKHEVDQFFPEHLLENATDFENPKLKYQQMEDL